MSPIDMYLYLGGKGADQTTYIFTTTPAKGGWNFGGNGGLDSHVEDQKFEPPENGAGGGGATDIRLIYYDINLQNPNNNSLQKSIESRIIVAGSGGGGNSGLQHESGSPDGFHGGSLTATSNNPYTYGGTQIKGTLGKGMDGINSTENQGGSGGCGSGYRGGYHKFPQLTETGSYHVGGTGGSSYISGHIGCISPTAKDTTPSKENSIHESGFIFTNTEILSGNESMPNPNGNSLIKGNVGHGICQITVLYLCPIESCVFIPYYNFF
ncbi:glycine-rich protein family, partial [Trichomonas vaginalis G3]